MQDTSKPQGTIDSVLDDGLETVDTLKDGIYALGLGNSVTIVSLPLHNMLYTRSERELYKSLLEAESQMSPRNTIMQDILYDILADIPLELLDSGQIDNFNNYARLSDLMGKDSIRLYAITPSLMEMFRANGVDTNQILQLPSIEVRLRHKREYGN